jgi:uncharacterized membrane protein YcaP (DUF421 family)
MLRLSGKKAVSQSTAFDFVVSLILGDLVDNFLFLEVPASEFVIAIATLVFADLIVKFISHRSDSFNFFVDGRPSVLVDDGKVQTTAMKREVLNHSDLLALLRLKGYDEQKLDEIKNAILEDLGHPSVLLKDEFKAVQKKEKENLKIKKE